MSTPHIEHFVDERGNFIYRAEFEGSFLSKDEAKELGKYVSGILDENHRLRELVRDMYACISHANEQDWFYFEREETGCGMSCTVNGEGCGLSVLADRMRELGIEVDDD